ncbi:MAG: DinB family protein [Phycisphaeraceae bacterium]|nr:DinB family protein [Phycisphaeraceae bacterium]MCW5755431.1 DinB family protein [Phycisphaeraceae bacterium]
MSQTALRPSVMPTPPTREQLLDELSRLSAQDLIGRYRWGVENFDRRVFSLTDEHLDMAWLPDAGVGQWPIRVLLGHLADAEIAYTFRVRKAIGEERPVVEAWDENAFIDAGMYALGTPPIGGFVAVVYTLRTWMGDLLSHLTPAQWSRKVMHSAAGEMSLRQMIETTTYHLERHAWYLNAKVERLLGPACEEERPRGGCGPACGCKS